MPRYKQKARKKVVESKPVEISLLRNWSIGYPNPLMGKPKDFTPSRIKESNLEFYKSFCNFPESVVLTAPGNDDRPENVDDDFVVFYAYPFELGYKFPFTPLVRSILTNFKVSPGQLQPSTWRILCLIEANTSDWEEVLGYEDVMSVYSTKKVNPFMYSFKKRPGCTNLVEQDGVNDRGWKEKYFYVEKDSLGDVGEFLKGGWSYEDVVVPEADGPTDLARKFVAEIPLKDRSFPKGADPPKYSLPNIPFEGMGSKNQMNESEMLKRAHLRMKEKTKSSLATPSTHSMPPPKRAKVDDEVTVLSVPGSSPSKSVGLEKPVEGITLGFPAGYLSSHEADVEIMPHAEKLLFPAAESRLQTMDIEGVMSQGTGYLLQALQNNLAASKYVKGAATASKEKSKKINELNHEINQLKNTVNNFESSKQEEIGKVRKEVKAELDELKQKLDDRDAKVTELQTEVDKLQPEVDRLTEENKDIEAYTTVFTRAKTAYEAVILRKSHDDMYKYINEWLEIGKMADLGPSPVAEDHPGETGGSRVDDSNKVAEQVADSAGNAARDGNDDAA